MYIYLSISISICLLKVGSSSRHLLIPAPGRRARGCHLRLRRSGARCARVALGALAPRAAVRRARAGAGGGQRGPLQRRRFRAAHDRVHWVRFLRGGVGRLLRPSSVGRAPAQVWPLQDIVSLQSFIVGVHHAFISPTHLQSLPYCNTITRPLRNIRPSTDPPFVCHTSYNIGDGNIV